MIIKEFIVYQDDDLLLTAENEEDQIDGVFVHTRIHSISPSKIKKYKRVWKEVVNAFRDKGITNIYATPLGEHDSSTKGMSMDEKWERVFGFKWTGVYLQGFKLMKYSQ